MTHPMGNSAVRTLLHSAAGIKVDKNDLRRFGEFVDEQIDTIAIAGRDAARWNGRDVIVPQDLPITKGVQ
jgi:hypothetical protein